MPLNVEIEEESEDEIDDSKEIQVASHPHKTRQWSLIFRRLKKP